MVLLHPDWRFYEASQFDTNAFLYFVDCAERAGPNEAAGTEQEAFRA